MSHHVALLLEFLGWGGVCYFAGAVVTAARIRHHKLTREAVVQIRDAKKWVDRLNRGHWPNTIMAIVLITVGISAYSSQHNHNDDVAGLRAQAAATQAQGETTQQLLTCVTHYANRLYDSLTPRQQAAEQLQHADKAFNDALVTMLTDALLVPPDPVQVKADAESLKAAARAKQVVATSLDRERSHNPYPPPPKLVCPRATGVAK